MSAIISYWRPMHSAPLDGTPVLTDCGIVRREDGCWCPCLPDGCMFEGHAFTPRVWTPVPELPVGAPDPVAGERAAQLASAAPRLLAAMQQVLAIDWTYGCEDSDGNMQGPDVTVAQDMVRDALNHDSLPHN